VTSEVHSSRPEGSGTHWAPPPPPPSRWPLPPWALALIVVLPLLGVGTGLIWKDFQDYLAHRDDRAAKSRQAEDEARRKAAAEEARKKALAAEIAQRQKELDALDKAPEAPPSPAAEPPAATPDAQFLAERLKQEQEARRRAEEESRKRAEEAERIRREALGPSPVSIPAEPPPTAAYSAREAAAREALLGYAAAVSRHDLAEAISYWKEPGDKTRRAIDGTEIMTVRPGRVVYNGGRHAEVMVEMVGKRRNEPRQGYAGPVDMELSDAGRWLILSMKGLKCTDNCDRPAAPAPSYPTPSHAGNDQVAVKSAVAEYYAALSRRDPAAARALRNTVNSRFDADVLAKEYASVNRLDEPSVYGDVATVWVDTTVKNFGGAPETWRGTLELMRRGGDRWVIASTRGLAKR
jgi:hypothetical protein